MNLELKAIDRHLESKKDSEKKLDEAVNALMKERNVSREGLEMLTQSQGKILAKDERLQEFEARVKELEEVIRSHDSEREDTEGSMIEN